MVTFSRDKHIIPYAGFLSLPVGDGYLTLSADDYDDILYVTHTVTEMELVDRFGDPCAELASILPRSLVSMAYLPSLLSFEPDGLNVEQLIGCCAVILLNKRFSSIMELSADDFAVLRFSDYILKEYQIPWKNFLDTCIPSDEFGKPLDTIPNKYVFLSLYPGQAPVMPGYMPQPVPMSVTAPPPLPQSPLKEEWEEFAENPDMVYVGSGAFMHKKTFDMLEVSGYDKEMEALITRRLNELGRGADEGVDTAHGKASIPVEASPPEPPVANPPDEAEEIRRALFNRQG